MYPCRGGNLIGSKLTKWQMGTQWTHGGKEKENNGKDKQGSGKGKERETERDHQWIKMGLVWRGKVKTRKKSNRYRSSWRMVCMYPGTRCFFTSLSRRLLSNLDFLCHRVFPSVQHFHARLSRLSLPCCLFVLLLPLFLAGPGHLSKFRKTQPAIQTTKLMVIKCRWSLHNFNTPKPHICPQYDGMPTIARFEKLTRRSYL